LTFVNRNEYALTGDQLAVPAAAGTRYYDLWRGSELTPVVSAGTATLRFGIEGLGFGAVLATRESPLATSIRELLAFMADRSLRPLSSYSREWKALPQAIVEIPRTRPADTAPPGMVLVRGGDYDFMVRGIEIEGGNDAGVDVQYPWEATPRRFHRQSMRIASFFIDRTPVTNQEYKRFLDATRYRPADDHNFLRDWRDGTFPEGWPAKPVTWVSIEDARAYAAWAGKRLPHEWEWQYAAQSKDGRLYPWGQDWDARMVPAPDHGPTRRPPSDVDAFPHAASPFGVLDLAGNVSQWSDEFRDEHTRAAIIRGAASYQPLGSVWYFPQTYRLDEHQKYLLMSPGRDRAGTIGFRLVVDAR
jgi:formylglycine-generating enzyme required for sulfatase activity